MSVSEKWMWARLRRDQLGFRFRRQYAVGPYFLDFFCPEAKLCIEIDGELHALRKARDAKRDAYLATNGILVLRIPALDLFEEADPILWDRWLDSIVQHCVERTGADSSKRLKPTDWN